LIKTIAILSPNQNAYSETFILAHKKLPFKIKYYYDGELPTKLEGAENMMQFNFLQRIKKRLKNEFKLGEYALIHSLEKENVDTILAEYGPTACATLKVVRYLKLPMIVHFHGYDASIKKILKDYKDQYRDVFQYAKSVIAVSNKMKETLMNAGCPEEKLVVSVYGPDPLFFNIQPSYDTSQFIAIGRFVEKKAPNLTILAFKKVTEKFPDARLVMVGDGELLPVCKKIVIKSDIEKNVVFKGVQSPEEIRDLMEGSIAFVQHSVTATNGDSEGTPVAILEAQAAALPVISTYHAGISDVVLNNVTGLLIEEQEVDGMAENMLRILQDTSLAKKLGEAGRKRIAENFTLEKHLQALTKEICKADPVLQ
jgi:glycosyltransferase involved in cell wall biosynthesis